MRASPGACRGKGQSVEYLSGLTTLISLDTHTHDVGTEFLRMCQCCQPAFAYKA